MSASYDWSAPRTAHSFTGYSPEGSGKAAGLVVHLAMHTPFPTTEEDRLSSNIKRIAGTVVAIAKVGFMRAPYKKASAKPGKAAAAKDKALEARAQPLFEVEQVRALFSPPARRRGTMLDLFVCAMVVTAQVVYDVRRETAAEAQRAQELDRKLK